MSVDEAGMDEAGMDEAGMDEAGVDEAGVDEAGVDEAEVDEVDGGTSLDEADDSILLLEEAQDPLLLQVWEPTGEPRVDAALDRLAELDPDDVHQHASVFDDIHRQLRATLTDLDATT